MKRIVLGEAQIMDIYDSPYSKSIRFDHDDKVRKLIDRLPLARYKVILEPIKPKGRKK